jgi:RHS repeat-associated protein
MTSLLGSSAPNSARLQLVFVYDRLGARRSKSVAVWNGSAYANAITTNYVCDAWNVIAETDLSGNLLRSYTWGNDISGTVTGAGAIGGLVVFMEFSPSSEVDFPQFDGAGNIVASVRGDGIVSGRYEYGPFGELIRMTGLPSAQANLFKYSTKIYDLESGLAFFGYRYYCAALGRWISRDPATEQGGINLLRFCDNNSQNRIDSDGRVIEDFSDCLNDLADWLEMAARAKATGDSEAFKMCHKFANAAAKRAMRAIVAEEGGAAGAAATGESAFVSAEVLEIMGAAATGAAIGVGAGLAVGFVVDHVGGAIGDMMKQIDAVNSAIIDYWADPYTR